jgi:hypothetical protein
MTPDLSRWGFWLALTVDEWCHRYVPWRYRRLYQPLCDAVERGLGVPKESV